eukprot:TCALIF_01748-PA protein Name:"Similar to Aldh1l2 Mitochondrial 10-formyltetrahydrofolate dehydrogenase (Mus musculus)" AED:0.05 eAED:0.05 QI:0/0.25/0/1/0/0.2/5/0/708
MMLGQSQFAANVYTLLKREGYRIVGVFTIPDKGGVEEPIAIQASQDGVKVFKHKSWRRKGVILSEVLEQYKSVGANLNVMPLCPQFIPMEVIESPRHQSISYHPSLLPRHRGASASNDTKDSLLQRFLLPEGAKAMVEAVNLIANGTAPRAPQPEEGATFDAFLNKSELCRVDLNQSAERVHNFIRGLEREPGSWIILEGQKIKVFQSSLASEPCDKDSKSLVVEGSDELAIAHPDGLFLKCGDGQFVKVELIQMEGGCFSSTKDYFGVVTGINDHAYLNLIKHDESLTKLYISGANEKDDIEINCDHFVNGKFMRGNRTMIYSVINPSNNECIHEIFCASDDDVTEAIKSAQKAFIPIQKAIPMKRFREVMKIILLSEELIRLKVLEQGILISTAKDALPIPLSQLESIDSQTMQRFKQFPNYVVEQVSGSWALGNSIVILSMGNNNLALMKLVEILQGLSNPGMITFLSSLSKAQEKQVVEHAFVTQVTYCNNPKKNVLQITLIFQDADVTKIIDKAVSIICGNLQPMVFIVDSGVYVSFLTALKEAFKQVKLGDPSDPQTQCGPLSTEVELNQLSEQILSLQENHATLVLGGKKDEQSNGFFFKPSIIICKLKHAHVFKGLGKGPVAGISKWKGQDVEQILDHFDPTSIVTIFTNNVSHALKIAENLKNDSCAVNDLNFRREHHSIPSDLISRYGKLKRVMLNYS